MTRGSNSPWRGGRMPWSPTSEATSSVLMRRQRKQGSGANGCIFCQGEAIQLVEGPPMQGRPRSVSGQQHEEQLLADCLSNRAQCILDMAQGKGVLPDGTPFSKQFEEAEHFDYFKRQAVKQAEECAEKACLVWCDDRSLFRLGLARKMTAESARVEAMWVMKEDNNEIMKDAGRCFLKAMKARPNPQTQKMLDEVKDFLAQRDVFSLYPEYV
ncbi:unnamed protein product [Effrenium voratum]|uniref:Uncharacterized protein n=1 Tax=Effrenium voratum TaxID=2562239 RepID=A0AA36IRU7_9DINO|nr:unnamed protein product [Effrenium voratum]CAJ1448567.1 unnamed protein product [Effrenium voratum]